MELRGISVLDRANSDPLEKRHKRLMDFGHTVCTVRRLDFANLDAEQRNEQFQEWFREGQAESELLKTLLREEARTFTETVSGAVDVETIFISVRTS